MVGKAGPPGAEGRDGTRGAAGEEGGLGEDAADGPEGQQGEEVFEREPVCAPPLPLEEWCAGEGLGLGLAGD